MLAIALLVLPVDRMVVCSKQWRMMSEIAEKQRKVTQVEIAVEVELLRSRMTMVTRARCVLARSRSNLLALCADSRSGAQMTRLSTHLARVTIVILDRSNS